MQLSRLHRRASASGVGGQIIQIDPAHEPGDLGGVGWRWISFSAHDLSEGGSVVRAGDDREVTVAILEGSVRIEAGGRVFSSLGSRASVFDAVGPPVLLVEPGRSIAITALGSASIAIAAAPRGDVGETRLIEPGTMRVELRGSGQTERTVRHLLPPEARAGRLILVEVLTPGGHWSSYPPHKHDTDDPPRERQLEELYYYRFRMAQGFAIQRVYTADRTLDDSMTPMNGDVILVPRGYHVVGVPPGYDCYYLNVMAGPVRDWRFTLDADHAWLMDWDVDRA